jgi:hypothetical protein
LLYYKQDFAAGVIRVCPEGLGVATDPHDFPGRVLAILFLQLRRPLLQRNGLENLQDLLRVLYVVKLHALPGKITRKYFLQGWTGQLNRGPTVHHSNYVEQHQRQRQNPNKIPTQIRDPCRTHQPSQICPTISGKAKT